MPSRYFPPSPILELPLELRMKILSYLPRQDLIAIAVVHRKFRSIVQNMLFAHVGFHACDGNGVAQTPAKKLLSFFFAFVFARVMQISEGLRL